MFSSEKTDVWAFGITLWEIMTRGCIPYPTIEPQKILTFIETDKRRMEKPDHAPAKVLFIYILEKINWPFYDILSSRNSSNRTVRS